MQIFTNFFQPSQSLAVRFLRHKIEKGLRAVRTYDIKYALARSTKMISPSSPPIAFRRFDLATKGVDNQYLSKEFFALISRRSRWMVGAVVIRLITARTPIPSLKRGISRQRGVALREEGQDKVMVVGFILGGFEV